MKTGAQHRITVDYREGDGDWERTVMVTLPTPQVIDLLLWLASVDAAAYAALPEPEQAAILQSIIVPGSGQSVPAAVLN